MLPNELKHPLVYWSVYRPIRLCLICHNCIWCGAHPHHGVSHQVGYVFKQRFPVSDADNLIAFLVVGNAD